MAKNQHNETTLNRAECPGEGKPVWRCIHDGAQVLAAFKTSGETECIHSIADFETFEEMQAAVNELKLTPLPEDEVVDRQIPLHEYRRPENPSRWKHRERPTR